jgi:hypothetical protein
MSPVLGTRGPHSGRRLRRVGQRVPVGERLHEGAVLRSHAETGRAGAKGLTTGAGMSAHLRLTVLVAMLVAALGAAAAITHPWRTSEAATASRDDAALRVLFLGNSFTFTNDLPALVRSLGSSDGTVIFTRMRAIPGAKARDLVSDTEARALLKEKWDYVVLQEQSNTPSFEEQRRTQTIPALRTLRDAARPTARKVVLFATWGYREGDLSNHKVDTYPAMQARLDEGFAEISRELSLPVVRVNAAWADAARAGLRSPLWAPDGRHPALAGSYLAACVFYATLRGVSPVGNTFTAGLPADEARAIQQIAAREALTPD